jgi:hypothetical protein
MKGKTFHFLNYKVVSHTLFTYLYHIITALNFSFVTGELYVMPIGGFPDT